MLDVYSDLTQQSAVFGNHFELLGESTNCTPCARLSRKSRSARSSRSSIGSSTSPRSANDRRSSGRRERLALDTLSNKHGLGSMAYYYESEENTPYREIVTSVDRWKHPF